MMVIRNKNRTREMLANPFIGIPMDERAEASNATDLTDNHIIEDLGNGYIVVKPIDETKKIKAKNMTEAKRILLKIETQDFPC